MEDHYSSEEEEVYFGSLAESEVLRRKRFLGDNYNSPVTPRPTRFNQASSGIQGGLPDVLGSTNTSTPAQRQLSVANRSDQFTNHKVTLENSLLNKSDDVIILNDSINHSIITLSDDESFIRNENTCSDSSPRDENVSESLVMGSVSIDEVSNNTDNAAEISESHQGCSSSDKGSVSYSVIAPENSLCESAIHNSENKNNLNNESALICETSNKSETIPVIEPDHERVSSGNNFFPNSVLIEDKSLHESAINNSDNGNSLNDELSANESCVLKSKVESNNSSLVEDIDEFVGDTASSTGNNCQHSFNMTGLSNLEFSLNGVTDSILNISHGSSLPSPPDTYQYTNQKSNLYEDISCDGEQLDNVSHCSNFDDKAHLHMSVDEVDFQQQRFSDNFVALSSLGNSTNISQPSEYKSCPSAHSSYTTAYDITCSGNHSYESFHNYRDVSTDLDICAEMDAVSIKSTEENTNDACFEMVMKNRQNSFNGSPVLKTSEDDKEGEKLKVISKLPVYHSSKTLLRPPKFCVKPDTLKLSSYKFAKQVSKAGGELKSSNLPKPQICKIPGPSTINKNVNSPSTKEKKIPMEKKNTFTETPSKIVKQNVSTPKQLPSMVKTKIPSHSLLSVNKTPAQKMVNKTPAQNMANKTPAQNIVKKTPATSNVNRTLAQSTSGIPRAVQSDSKVKRALTPLRDHNTNGLSAGKSISTNNKYKNIISPIQAYIRGCPPVSQRKAQIISEEQKSPEQQRSKTQNVTSVKSATRVVQRLEYGNVEGQENVNPNVIDLSRDTIPCKILEPSLEVFWKEEEQPQHRLPKMGEKITKILAGTPKVKVTIHEGRVTQSPKSKGILMPNNENSAASDTPIAESLSSEETDGRISVRMQKTIDL